MLHKVSFFDYEDEDEDDLIKIEVQNTIFVICFLSSDTCPLSSVFGHLTPDTRNLKPSPPAAENLPN
jgi:hypothetical protein